MTDIGDTIAPKSDQLNADDLITGPRTIRVTKVVIGGSPEQPAAIYFEGDNGKPYKPGKSMRRVLYMLWGKVSANYVGRSMTLYRDPDVIFGGANVCGIRISHMSDIDGKKVVPLAANKAQRKPFEVLPLAKSETRQAPKSESIYDSEWVESAEREIEAATDGAVLNEWWETTAKDDRAELYKANKQAYGALKAKLDAKLSEIGG